MLARALSLASCNTCLTALSYCTAHTSEAAAPVLRSGRVKRETKETKVDVTISIDGTGRCKAHTPIHFLNHMLDVSSALMLEHDNSSVCANAC